MMNKIKLVLISNNISVGYLYFYIHLITEVISFYFLSKQLSIPSLFWIVPFVYDGMVFVPQSIIGYINDKYPKVNMSLIGVLFLLISSILYIINFKYIYISLIILCLGNTFIHVGGAESTIKASNGKLSHSAIFVSGGSFGVITGKLLSKSVLPSWIMILLVLTLIPFILLVNQYKTNKKITCKNYNYNKNKNSILIIFLAVLVVIVRGYMGCGIPTSWNKTTIQTILLFVTMGFGKAMGGIFSDAFGIKKVALLSVLLAIPFLCIGDNNMIVSLIGVMFFSMTMSITLAILVSELKNNPGFAFGLTTIGLFLGTVPIFIFKITNTYYNILVITILSIMCAVILNCILKGDKEKCK